MSLDLGEASWWWKIPSDEDPGEVEHLDDETRVRLGIPDDELPALGDRVEPSGRLVAPQTIGPYAFLCERNGEPAVVLPTRVYRYIVRQEAAPPNGMRIIKHCLSQLADAVGCTFEFAGTFSSIPDLWDPNTLSIAWALDAEYREYEARAGFTPGSSIGLGGPVVVSDPHDHRLRVTGGSCVLNAEMKATTEIGPALSHSVVLLHELGHAFNLDHVTSRAEVMYPGSGPDGPTLWGPGDRRGLFVVAAVS